VTLLTLLLPTGPTPPLWVTTVGGRNVIAGSWGDRSGSRPAPPDYLALSSDNTWPAASDASLAGEITTPGGGLVRGAATYAHTSGTDRYTLTRTFTATGSDTLPVVVRKIGVFNAASGGAPVWEYIIPAPMTISVVGGAVTVTHTVRI
jgi:hypothetical protein